jgi:hypothetical protein
MNKETKYSSLVILLVLIIAIFWIGRGMCVSEDTAVQALETQGFSNVKVTHKAYFFISCRGGSEDDDVMFTCNATNPAGKEVTVYVFAGWPFKGATVRTK